MTRCLHCKTPVIQHALGRPRRYCSDSCRVMASRKRKRASVPRDDWRTPQWLRDRVLAEHQIGLDACAFADSALVPNYLGTDHLDHSRRDALAYQSWYELLPNDGMVWCNPPYRVKALRAFLERCKATAEHGVPVLALVPASTSSDWWHTYCQGAHVEFLRGRLVFTSPGVEQGPAPFASALVLFG